MQEIADRSAAEPAAWSIRSGRLLQFGPDWPESGDRLAFDACSGDYWVLDELGHHVVQRLLESGVLSAETLQPEAGLPGGVEGLEPVLARLQEAGLIQAARGTSC